ncbi:MAG: hydroxyacid dehydrogenase [Rhodospirillales bacterium]|jgi:D-3-phosphoglycerate dehydrogenase
MADNARRLVFFEEWMDTDAALAKFDEVDDVQVSHLHYADPKSELDAAMARAHGYQVQSRTELQEPWFPNSEFLTRAPNIVAVSSTGAGYDYIDVSAMTAAGVAVVNQGGTNKESVAEHALGMMLAVSKKMIQADRRLRRESNVDRMELTGAELLEKTVGIVGLGQIGTRTAELCRLALRMDVIAFDPYLSEAEISSRGARKVDFEELLLTSDFISVHCPRTEETLNMFGAEQFKKMKSNAVFVTTARGGITDEEALAEALSNGEILGAGVDVFWKEPTDPSHPLMALDNVLVTPHHAGITTEANRNMSVGAAEQWIGILRGKKPPRLVNPEVWPAYQKRFERIMGFRPED